ncbi:hypothetical protein F5Y18DRAFT_11284 [Xylariaceae sp. FL1019]|nr:hypothetical protein F5Y18DRAFT_11284 [Xylariaceae sp. FL1019]
MPYPPYPYLDTLSFASLYTEPMLGSHAMEPEIERSASPTSSGNAWNPNSFGFDKGQSQLMRHQATASMFSPPIFPGSHFPRPDSPPYTHSSSTCSSALSPPRDTDYGQIASPPTNQDANSASQYETWSSHGQLFQHTGLADACANPGSVTPYMDASMSFGDDSMRVFEFPARTLSMSSDESTSNETVWNEVGTCTIKRHTSPDSLSPNTSLVKDEICIPDTIELSSIYASQDEQESGGDEDSLIVKTEPIDDTDDADYSPPQKQKREGQKSCRPPTSNKRRRISQSSSNIKRPKFGQEEVLVVRTATKPPFQGSKGHYICPNCPKVSFKDQNGLDSHTKKQHTRPFTCVFDFAGCTSTFASKNEWKRHCASQHLALQYWVCQQDGCAEVSNKVNNSKKSSTMARRRSNISRCQTEYTSGLPNGTIFNRKDLYTQHLRRMHVPGHLKKQVKSKKHVPEWDERQKAHQDQALRTRCHLPTHMACPAPQCAVQFDGTNAWDERMEHVAKHLEKAAAGTESSVQFGGDNDCTLVDWASHPTVGVLRHEHNGKWTLHNPLRSMGPDDSDAVQEEDEDADAEGEEVYDL